MATMTFKRLTTPVTLERFKECWSEKQSEQMVEAGTSWLKTDDPGEILIGYVGLKIVGITGWYPLDVGVAFLRWHGVLPIFQRNNHSTVMLAKLMKRLTTHYGINTLYELADNQKSVDYFLGQGFTLVPPKEVPKNLRKEAGNFKYVLRRYIT